MPLPNAIQNAPDLNLGLEFYYNAFVALGRQSSEWAAVHQYCLAYDITGQQREDLFYILRQLESFYLELKSGKT